MHPFDRAESLLHEFKGDRYIHGVGVLPQVGQVTAAEGQRAALVRSSFAGSDDHIQVIRDSLTESNVAILGEIASSRPNAPREDLIRITDGLAELSPDVVVTFSGGSTLDAVKTALVLWNLGGRVDDYFGTGLVTEALERSGGALTPHVAIQTAASSGAHLTKYANITDLSIAQKKLIVDEAIVPVQPAFDYGVTLGAPAVLTADGAMDGLSHCLEVLYGAAGKPGYAQIEAIAIEGIRLIVEALPRALDRPHERTAREALGLGTDLGGYAIMLGGTNGGHLTSFSLVDVLSHGRACGLLNPYYTVLFSPAIQQPLRAVGRVYQEAGYGNAELDSLSGRRLGLAVAEAMIALARQAGLPATLEEVPGFGLQHIERALKAAKDPQLRMKLKNMPVPLEPAMVDEAIGPVLEAARTGELGLIRTFS